MLFEPEPLEKQKRAFLAIVPQIATFRAIRRECRRSSVLQCAAGFEVWQLFVLSMILFARRIDRK